MPRKKEVASSFEEQLGLVRRLGFEDLANLAELGALVSQGMIRIGFVRGRKRGPNKKGTEACTGDGMAGPLGKAAEGL
jgi:hypothetical protein